MFGRGKKPVSLAYKEKLLADIAYYEKRIDEALNKKKLNSSEDVVSSDEDSNPYTVNIGPFPMELKREEAKLSNCASMTLELATLTIMQSEVNVMAIAPDVRKPVYEDGTWLEVAAECKIDLISFTITFYAHKPHRKFAPTRYRGLRVSLTKPAHERELSQSVLPKLSRPHLALQVLQSYATAFRSRRTTLLELAEKYADRLKMDAMPEGGYRVKFLDLLTVEWTLENMWSPVVGFCHRMKFEVEYMPKHYIHAIGKLYKQFKDPSLETPQRTDVMAKIFDICLEAQGLARELQDSLESDPETAGRLHERRTTMDPELEVPSNCDQNVQVSPQKLPKGKENRAHNRKTTMAPPKTIPKKAKKAASVNNKAKAVDDDVVSQSSETNDKVSTSDDVTNYPNDNNAAESRKSVKRAIENDTTSNVKKIRTDERNGAKPSDKVTDDGEASGVPNVSSKSNAQKKDKAKPVGKDTDVNPINDTGNKNADAIKSANSINPNKLTEASAKNAAKKVRGDKNTATSKEIDTDVAASKNEAKGKRDAGSVATSKTSMIKTTGNDGKNVASAKDQGTEGSVASSKNRKMGEDGKSVGTESSVAKSKNRKMGEDGKSVGTESSVAKSKNRKMGEDGKSVGTEGSVASSKNSKKGEDGKSVVGSKNASEKDSIGGGSTDDLNKKVKDNKNKAPAKNCKDTTSSVSSKSNNAVEKESNKLEKAKLTEVVEKNKVNKEIKAQKDNNEKQKASKAPTNDKVNVNKKTNIDNNQAKQIACHEVTEKSVKAKQSTDKVASKSNDKNKESIQRDAVKNIQKKTNQNTKTVGNNTQNINKNKESLEQKMTKPNTEVTKNTKNDINRKNAGTVVQKTKAIVPTVSNAQEATTSNRNETVKKAENNKMAAKFSTKNLKDQNKDKAGKLQNINPKTESEITKSNVARTTFKSIHTEKSNLQRIQENQAKVAEKLKTKIPIIKDKLKIGSFDNKFGKEVGKPGKHVEKEKTKIPLKSLPVFKKIVRNGPSRMSPRKNPASFKPSSRGFSSK